MRRKLSGKIISDKMDKTRVVLIERLKKHPKYKKYFRVSSKLKAHDEKNEYKTGDFVLLEESRPISREKKWTIIEKKK
ncbi:MAG: 30S ribosomal protein S17 [Candidatus Pacebacteria bacterium]|nr:30S ribosomal protein S17 [Candidatus Paceibacterota bacterium]